MAVNKVILVGNVGQDPEIRTLQNGGEVANFSLATTESWKDKATGEKKDRTEWHRVVVFSSGLVNIVKNYVKKGSKLYLEGQLQSRKWTDNNGIEKSTTEIVLQNFNSALHMLDSARSGASSGYASERAPAEPRGGASGSGAYGESNRAQPSSGGRLEEELDDDIPF